MPTVLSTQILHVNIYGTVNPIYFQMLWDDIDTTLPPEDKEAFDTLADAHVGLHFTTN